ncbi:hypothetical protein HEB94_007124 [Actinopolymorpha pittospori]|uniref:Uncharacterized protein n=1 Tax=Actinopolymorpha pittospori TaxID=648752 RepID=A0A927RMK6_9ACTN|nr:hypothetical protein [Actinopolymorpha pittospori]
MKLSNTVSASRAQRRPRLNCTTSSIANAYTTARRPMFAHSPAVSWPCATI